MSLLRIFAVTLFSTMATTSWGVTPDQKTLPIGLAPWERVLRDSRPAPLSQPPVGPVHALGEWEESEAAMTLWTNASYVGALASHGAVKLLADSESNKTWWSNWLRTNGINTSGVTYFVVPTDSIWVRDYGPWFIVDGDGHFGLVDTKYNRPRPRDDEVPAFISRELGIPMYQPGLTHTGGNFYNDGVGNAFSSTLVYSENNSLTHDVVDQRMHDFLGIERYTTSPLAPGITIEHIDTFGKLVAPDTFVWSEFPAGSRYRADSETYVALLRKLKSPYGTPYKIHRLKMTPIPASSSDDFRAYINAFISNRALYFPTYGDNFDAEAKATFAAALPGYDIVGVASDGTSWGDSVHCRSRNLLRRDTIFIFPTVEDLPARAGQEIRVVAEIVPSPGFEIDGTPSIEWTANGTSQDSLPMTRQGARTWQVSIPGQASGTHVALIVKARDTSGKTKTAPIGAPAMTIDFDVP